MVNTAYSNVPHTVLLGDLNALTAILIAFNAMVHQTRSVVNAQPISIYIKIPVQPIAHNIMMTN